MQVGETMQVTKRIEVRKGANGRSIIVAITPQGEAGGFRETLICDHDFHGIPPSAYLPGIQRILFSLLGDWYELPQTDEHNTTEETWKL